jgi:Ni/Co efflux regulator RcnB
MKNLLFAGVAGMTMLVATPASAASDSFTAKADQSEKMDLNTVFEGRRGGGHGPTIGGHGPRPNVGHGPRPNVGHGPRPGGGHRWGHRMGGRWHAGHFAPGGWGGYRIPYRGFSLPTYWIQPTYRIVNYPVYGLYQPQQGYGWSRYYDDAVLMDNRGTVQDYRSGIAWDRMEGGYAPGDYQQPQYGPAMGADRGVYNSDDRVYAGEENDDYVYDAPPAPQQTPVSYPQPAPQYGAPYSQAPNNAGGYAPQPTGPGYQSRYGFERYEQCLKNRGLTGGVIGAVVGAVAGNRIAGRGDRLPGSLIGGGLGALAGVGIEKATNKCRKYLPDDDRYYGNGGGYQQGGYQGGYGAPPAPAPAPAPQQYPYGYQQQGGYYYPPQQGYYYYPQQAPSVTTVTVTPAPTVTTTTTVTEEVYYETVPVKRKAVRKWKPKPRAKPRPKCHCH